MKDKNGDDIEIGKVYQSINYAMLVEEVDGRDISGQTLYTKLFFDDVRWDTGDSLDVTPCNDEFWKRCLTDKVRYLKLDELKEGEIYQELSESGNVVCMVKWSTDLNSTYHTREFENHSKVICGKWFYDSEGYYVLPATEDQISQFNKLTGSGEPAQETQEKEEKPVVKGFNVLEKVTVVEPNTGHSNDSGTPRKTGDTEAWFPYETVNCWKLEPDLTKPIRDGYEFEYGQVQRGDDFMGCRGTFCQNDYGSNDGKWRWIVKKSPEDMVKIKPEVNGFNVLTKEKDFYPGDWYLDSNNEPRENLSRYTVSKGAWKLEPKLPKPVDSKCEVEYRQLQEGEDFVSNRGGSYLTNNGGVFTGRWRWVVVSEKTPEKPKNPPIKMNGQTLEVGKVLNLGDYLYTLNENNEIEVGPVTKYCCESTEDNWWGTTETEPRDEPTRRYTISVDKGVITVEDLKETASNWDGPVPNWMQTISDMYHSEKIEIKDKVITINLSKYTPKRMFFGLIKKVFGFDLDKQPV